jgi:hypothetical protein
MDILYTCRFFIIDCHASQRSAQANQNQILDASTEDTLQLL